MPGQITKAYLLGGPKDREWCWHRGGLGIEVAEVKMREFTLEGVANPKVLVHSYAFRGVFRLGRPVFHYESTRVC